MDSMEYIDSYFNGAKSEEEKLRFEKRVLEDEEFAQEVAFYISAKGAIKSQVEDEKKQRFRQLYNEHKDENQQEHKVVPMQKRTRMNFRYLAAASIAVIVISLSVIFLANNEVSPPQLAETYIEKNMQTLGVTMGSREDSLQTGLGLYNEGKLPEALQIFNQLEEAPATEAEAKKFAAIIYLRQEKYDQALERFTQLAADTVSFSNRAKFYQALTLMKRNREGDKENATRILQEVRDKNLDGKATAVEWLKKLE